MHLISHFLHQGFSFIVPLVVLLGVLIFVHEFGHFAVAKFFGVRVEVFSLGFGRKILQKKVGDTVYCLSAIPFGGYVKMFGDDPSAKIPIEEQKYSFNHQPVLPRIAVVLAGPMMNALFAVLLFSVIAGVGEEAIRPQLGDVAPQTAAYSAGFRTDDIIQKVNGVDAKRWEDLKKGIEEANGKNVSFDVLRGSEHLTLQATPTASVNKNVLSSKSIVGEIEGINYLKTGSGIGVITSNSIAGKAGFKTGDIIKKINGVDIDTWDALPSKLVSGAKVEVERGLAGTTTPQTLTLQLPEFKNFKDLGIESSELYLSSIQPKSGAEAAGIQPGDKILKIGNTPIDRWETVVKNVQGFKPSEQSLKVQVQREGKVLNLSVVPQMVTQADQAGMEKKNYALGVVTGLVLTSPATFTAKEIGVGAMLTKGFDDTVRWTYLTALSFVKLVQRKVSAKSIGGPLMIGKLASETWKIGISPFLKIMAIISINLFVLNLLPVPVLDGGHLLFFTIELIKGSPLSFRKLEIMQQVGMALLLALMVFSMFNDIVRLFAS